MKFKPKNREELQDIIKEIIENQEKKTSYRYGLKDVDVSLITNINNLFSCFENPISDYELNRKINWNDPRNSIIQWNTSKVTSMFGMFYESSFNQPIGNWDVNNVIDMSGVFYMSQFNQDISNWDISNTTSISWMFAHSKFNQDLSNWIFTLNRNCNLKKFNYKSKHQENYGKINSYKDFIEKQLTKDFIDTVLKSSNEKEKYELLKLLKNSTLVSQTLYKIDREIN